MIANGSDILIVVNRYKISNIIMLIVQLEKYAYKTNSNKLQYLYK